MCKLFTHIWFAVAFGIRDSTDMGDRRAELRVGAAVLEPLERRSLLAATIYVDGGSPGPTHNGTSWGSAYIDLQAALAAAVSGDKIRIARGTYKPTATTDRTVSFNLKTG